MHVTEVGQIVTGNWKKRIDKDKDKDKEKRTRRRQKKEKLRKEELQQIACHPSLANSDRELKIEN